MRWSLLTAVTALSGATSSYALTLPGHYRSPVSPVASRAGEINTREATVRFMPFGASIVEITCWRAYLWQKLHDAGITNVDFVGSNSGPANCTLNGANVPFDHDHEGHSGAKAAGYVSANNLPPWLASAKPDIILMHLGTNDVVARTATQDILAAYTTLLSQMRAANPQVVLLVSKLIAVSPKNFGQDISDNIGKLNDAITPWAASKNVTVIDAYTGFDPSTMTKEGEHPNEAGDVFLANRYFAPVRDALVSVSVAKGA